MNILIVGAGAVGQIYGYYLSGAGAKITYLVRPHSELSSIQDFVIYDLNQNNPLPLHFEAAVMKEISQVARYDWDQVWFCVPSTSLRQGRWVDQLIEATGNPLWVSLQPGLEDLPWLSSKIQPSRLAYGMIPFFSYPVPLQHEHRWPQPGMAYWMLPFQKALFCSHSPAARVVVELLSEGGLPSKLKRHLALWVAQGSAVLMPLVVALESAQWSLENLDHGQRLKWAARAAREAMSIARLYYGKRKPLLRFSIQPWSLLLALKKLRDAAPFDLEAYLAFHFSKVKSQTQEMMVLYIRHGRMRGLKTKALEKLIHLAWPGFQWSPT